MSFAQIKQVLNYDFFGSTLQNIGIAIIIFLLFIIFLPLIKKIIIKKIDFAKKDKTNLAYLFLEVIKEFSFFSFVILGIFASSYYLNIPGNIWKWIEGIAIGVITLEATKALIKIILFSIQKYAKKNGDNMIVYMGGFIKFAIWTLAFLFFLQNIGINVTALIAGLGIGGIAIALAAQNIFSDMFSSFAIFLDQPFKVGDFIIVGDLLGTVKKIGIKTTRIEALSGEEVIIPNTDLISSRIHNYKRMQKRRVSFKIGVEYGTPINKLKKIPEMVKKVVEKIENSEIDRVHLLEFGDFSLNYEIVFYVMSKEYNDYADIKQNFNFEIIEAFEKEKINIAFPTNKVFVEKA